MVQFFECIVKDERKVVASFEEREGEKENMKRDIQMEGDDTEKGNRATHNNPATGGKFKHQAENKENLGPRFEKAHQNIAQGSSFPRAKVRPRAPNGTPMRKSRSKVAVDGPQNIMCPLGGLVISACGADAFSLCMMRVSLSEDQQRTLEAQTIGIMMNLAECEFATSIEEMSLGN